MTMEQDPSKIYGKAMYNAIENTIYLYPDSYGHIQQSGLGWCRGSHPLLGRKNGQLVELKGHLTHNVEGP